MPTATIPGPSRPLCALFALALLALTACEQAGEVRPAAPAAPRGDRVSVLDFGADPSGTRDSGAAIRAALAALGERGGVCHLPAGTYRLDLPEDWLPAERRFRDQPADPRRYPCLIPLRSNITLQGDGWGTVLDARAVPEAGRMAVVGTYGARGPHAEPRESTDIQIRDLRILGGATDLHMNQHDELGVPTGIVLNAVSRFAITGVRVERFPGLSIIYINSRQGLISGNSVDFSLRDGCTGFGALHDIRIVGNRFSRIMDDAIAINYMRTRASDTDPRLCPRAIVIADNVIDHVTSRGINLMHVRDTVVSGNSITAARLAGIRVCPDDELGIPHGEQRARNVAITGNTVRDTWWGPLKGWPHQIRAGAGDGIHIAHGDRITVTGNVVAESRRYGLALDDVDGAVVTGNQFDANAAAAGWERAVRRSLWSANLADGPEALQPQRVADDAPDLHPAPVANRAEPAWEALASWLAPAPVPTATGAAGGR